MPSGYTFDSNHGPGIGMSSAGSSGSGSSGYSSSGSGSSAFDSIRNVVSNMASNISNIAKTNTSTLGDKVREILQNPASSASQAAVYNIMDTTYDMDEYYDMLMDLAGYNNNWAAGQAQLNRNFQSNQANRAMQFEADQAQKMMDFQTRSDQAAMAWSAKEAQKERDWSKNLSDTAHRREVKDLLAAGLNPILSANAGAWSGSGAAGQGYSSSGAMGSGHAGSGATAQTDMSTAGVIGSLMANQMTTARDMAVSKLQADTQRYNTNMQYAIAKMQAETSIYNNNSNIDANKAIRALDRDADIRKAGIQAGATRDAAAMSAGAITSAAYTQAEASKRNAELGYNADIYKAGLNYDLEKYKHDNPSGNVVHQSEHNLWSDPVQYGGMAGEWFVDKAIQIGDSLAEIGNRAQRNGRYKD